MQGLIGGGGGGGGGCFPCPFVHNTIGDGLPWLASHPWHVSV